MKHPTHVPEKIIAEWYSPDRHYKVDMVAREHRPYQLALIAVTAWEGGERLNSQSTFNEPSARLKFEAMKQQVAEHIAQRAFGL